MSLNEVSIRKATLQDLDILFQFEQGIVQTERPFDPTLKKGHIHYYDLKAFLSDPLASVVVAEYNNQIIASGYALIKEAKPYLQHEQYAYLGFMYVDPQYRGKGINALIVESLKDFAKSKGLTEVRLEVYAQNVAAIKAYEKVGFEQHMIEMRMRIE